MRYFILLFACIYAFADCKIVNEEDNSLELILTMDCTYKLGESEALMDAKANLFYDAKLKTKNKVGELVISELNSKKINTSSNYILEYNTNIISPSIVKIEELSNTQNNNNILLKLKTYVDKKYIQEYSKGIMRDIDAKKNDNLSSINETLPEDALMREAIFKEKAKNAANLDSNKTSEFSDKSKDNIINSTYRTNLDIKRKILKQNSYNDIVDIPTVPSDPDYHYFEYKKQKVDGSIFAETETRVIINSEQAKKLRNFYPSSLGIFSNKANLIVMDNNEKYKRKLTCNEYSAGLNTKISIMLEFYGSSKTIYDSINIGDCIDISIIEENRNIAVYHPVKILGFESTKEPQVIIDRKNAILNKIKEDKDKNEYLAKKEANDKMFTSLMRNAIGTRWNSYPFKDSKKDFDGTSKCIKTSANVNSKGIIKVQVIQKSNNEFFNKEAEEFINELNAKTVNKYSYKSPSKYRELDSDNIDFLLNLCIK